ncbi:hypothetical protein OG235_24890 [Streptomyces sp. NBC_00024]|uniref:hypothetical protein n=1 Tax=Streptomyces sp. NBC_00024 TaxID=2903612 RepID=UPI00324C9645
MKRTRTVPRPDAQPGPLGHGYCWKTHPGKGVHCVGQIGHSGAHLYPYVRPAIRWP